MEKLGIAKQWAIAVGISQYTHMLPLPYAKRDATAIRAFLTQDATFDQTYCFSDDSPDAILDGGATFPTQPTLLNLKRFLQVRFTTPFLAPEDTLWFFFSGHGLHYANRDYLLPCDADPEAAETSAILIDDLVECLKRCGTRNIILVLDACHTEEQKFGQGFGTDPSGVITLFSADFNQAPAEIEDLQQGSFTYALLEGFRLLGKYRNATLNHLYKYLCDRLPKLNREYGKPTQTPRLHADSEVSPDLIPVPPIELRKNVLQQLIPVLGNKPSLGDVVPTSPNQIIITPSLVSAIGAAVLGVGLIGYVGYQKVIQPPVAIDLSQSQAATAASSTAPEQPNATKPGTRKTNLPQSKASDGSRNSAIADLGSAPFVRVPKVGKYYAVNAKVNSARREIGRVGDRFCIKMISDDLTITSGDRTQVIVSSLTLGTDGVYVDATRQKLKPDEGFNEFTDGKVIWQWLDSNVKRSGLMGECLASDSKYVRRTKGG